jgi:hypothetical protein
MTDAPPAFSAWLGRHAPHAVVIKMPPFPGPRIKQVKPAMLLHLLDRGLTDVTWLDTDLIVLRDLEPLFTSLDDETLLFTQDLDFEFSLPQPLLQHYGQKMRRPLEHSINTCLERVTSRHAPLLEACRACLSDPVFLEEQAKPKEERKEGFGYEQRIVEMLLSTNGRYNLPEYPVRFMPNESAVIHEVDVRAYGLWHRLKNGLGWHKPFLVHMAYAKPWDHHLPWIRRFRAASVYSAFAETYRAEMEEEMPWANSSGLSSRIARLLSLGQPHWVGWAHGLASKARLLIRAGTIKRTR